MARARMEANRFTIEMLRRMADEAKRMYEKDGYNPERTARFLAEELGHIGNQQALRLLHTNLNQYSVTYGAVRSLDDLAEFLEPVR